MYCSNYINSQCKTLHGGTNKHSVLLYMLESYIEVITLLKHSAVTCVRHRVVVDEVSPFFRLVTKLVFALSCCKKKKNVIYVLQSVYFVAVPGTVAVTGCPGGCRLSMR